MDLMDQVRVLTEENEQLKRPTPPTTSPFDSLIEVDPISEDTDDWQPSDESDEEEVVISEKEKDKRNKAEWAEQAKKRKADMEARRKNVQP